MFLLSRFCCPLQWHFVRHTVHVVEEKAISSKLTFYQLSNRNGKRVISPRVPTDILKLTPIDLIWIMCLHKPVFIARRHSYLSSPSSLLTSPQNLRTSMGVYGPTAIEGVLDRQKQHSFKQPSFPFINIFWNDCLIILYTDIHFSFFKPIFWVWFCFV